MGRKKKQVGGLCNYGPGGDGGSLKTLAQDIGGIMYFVGCTINDLSNFIDYSMSLDSRMSQPYDTSNPPTPAEKSV